MSRIDRNVAFNTVLAVSLPDSKRLSHLPATSGPPRFHQSSLKNYSDAVQIVWIAKELEWTSDGPAYDGIVEVHFVGTRDECLQFMQINHHVPKLACKVKCEVNKGVFEILPCGENDATQSAGLDKSWLITYELQQAVVEERIDVLPKELFVLDPDQERVLLCKPPLLLESRSGTGKTNCLFW